MACSNTRPIPQRILYNDLFLVDMQSGHEYEAKSFTAYLPDSEKGRRLKDLLKKAFDQEVLFKSVSNASLFDAGHASLELNNVTFKSKRSGVYVS